jgi:hypothetical protein
VGLGPGNLAHQEQVPVSLSDLRHAGPHVLADGDDEDLALALVHEIDTDPARIAGLDHPGTGAHALERTGKVDNIHRELAFNMGRAHQGRTPRARTEQ